MSLDPHDLTRWGLHGLQFVMLAVVFVAMRWNRRRPGVEFPVMIVSALALGPLGSLFRAATRSAAGYYEPWEAWVDLAFLMIVIQAAFWSAFLRLRKRHIAERVADA